MMKKRHILHWAMGVMMTPLLGSCTSDDVVGGAGREECDIILGQPMTVTSVTRATDGRTSSTQFDSGETVWLWANKTDGTEYIKAWQLKADGNGDFSSFTTGADKYWPSDGSSLDVYALHGNFENSPSISEGTTKWLNLSLTHTVKTDQSSDVNKRLSDLLYSHPSPSVAPNNTVPLTFDHLLAKITVKLDLKNSNGINAGELANAEVTLTNMLTSGDFKSTNVSTIITDGVSANTAGSIGEIKAGKITQPSDMNSTDYEVGSAIVPLQDFGATTSNKITITLSSDTRSFSYTPADVTLGKGNEYIYTLRIIGNKITGSLSVSEFDSEDKSIPFKDYFDYLADLKNRNYLGSKAKPHDLSYDYNGQMNTANCYVVTHPGYYKFPLVYGNAIKNGATNASAYRSSTFVNHLGNPITEPYIYDNSNNNSGKLEAKSAELVWQDAPNLISNNISLCDDQKYIKFQITKENIQQGNAVIAVKDGNGKIMWSWHIWVTNKNVYETQAVTASNKTLMFMPFPLGWNDSTPAPTCTFYQWGRKDPFPPSNGSNSDITLYAYETTNPTMKNEAQTSIQTSIMNPLTFYGTGTASWENTSALDLWNVGNTDTDVNFNLVTKSVYDPSPAGFHLPCTAAFTGFTTNNGSWNSTTNGYTFTTNNVETYWQACGFRAYNSGSLNDVGSIGDYWSAGPSHTTSGLHLNFLSGGVGPQGSSGRANGFSVRPVSE